MKLTDSYKQNPQIDDYYDAICIGSGIGSLTTANVLARNGLKVLVLEKHYTPGGYTHVFTRTEYEWDVGIHYLGEVHKKGSIMNRLFNYLSNKQLLWEELGDVYDRIFFGGKEYPFVKGTQNFKENLIKEFPEEKEAIDQYINMIYDVDRAGKTFFAEKVLPDPIRWVSGGFLRKKLLKYSRQTTYEAISKLTSNKKLIGVLTAQYGDYGMSPKESSFAMHAVVAKHYLNGASYPIGGCEEIFKTISPAIIESGGNVLTNAEVKGLLVENNVVKGVKMYNGKEIRSKYVISGIGATNTINHLLTAEQANKFPLKKELQKINVSTGHLCLYIGLKENVKSLGLNKANYWLYPDNYDHDENVKNYLNDPENNPLPVAYISFPSAKDPKWEEKYPNKSTIEIITLAPFEWFEKWDGTRWKKRGEDYDTLKEKWAQRLLEQLYKVEPQLKGKIDYYELSTPLSTQKFANYDRGEIYGLNHGPARYEMKHLRPQTPIKNFFLTGQDILSVGFAAAAMSGVLTSSVVLKKNVLMSILKSSK